MRKAIQGINDKNIADARMALDMAHADIWLKLKTLEETNTQSLVVKQVELEAIKLLLEAAMKELGVSFVG